MDDQRVDYPGEGQDGGHNGWSRFENLMLAGMRENRDLALSVQALVQESQRDIADIKLVAAVAAEQAKALSAEVAILHERVDDTEEEISILKSFKERAHGVMAVIAICLAPVVIPVAINLLTGGVTL